MLKQCPTVADTLAEGVKKKDPSQNSAFFLLLSITESFQSMEGGRGREVPPQGRVCHLHVDDQGVCQVAQGPGCLGTDVGRLVVEGIQNGIGCVCHKHHILSKQKLLQSSSSQNTGDFLSNTLCFSRENEKETSSVHLIF